MDLLQAAVPILLYVLSGAAAGCALMAYLAPKAPAAGLAKEQGAQRLSFDKLERLASMASMAPLSRQPSLAQTAPLARYWQSTPGQQAELPVSDTRRKCRRDSKIAAIQSSFNAEAEVRTLQRGLAALQGTSRQVHQVERAHDALKEELDAYKAAQQEALVRSMQGVSRCFRGQAYADLLGIHWYLLCSLPRRMQGAEEQMAALRASLADLQPAPGQGEGGVPAQVCSRPAALLQLQRKADTADMQVVEDLTARLEQQDALMQQLQELCQQTAADCQALSSRQSAGSERRALDVQVGWLCL